MRNYPQIRYAQCWEDPSTLRKALEISPADDVVSIASGGENSFALLLDHPRSLTAVDSNPAQLFLVELKMRAIQRLDYDDFIAFVGARPCRDRARLYRSVRDGLTAEAQGYWDARALEINQGVIHCGKFENYFSIFRRLVLPLIHNRDRVRQLLAAPSVVEQRIFYDRVWNTRRWRALVRIFFGKLVMGRLGRDPAVFRYVAVDDIADELLERARRGASEVPLQGNYFLEYILTGHFSDLERCHPYMSEANFYLLRERLEQLRLVRATLDDYLARVGPGTLSKCNLSDIFEYMSPEDFESSLRHIVRSSRDGAKLAFWTTFVSRLIPANLTGDLQPNDFRSQSLFAADRTFFYGSFNLWTVKRKELMRNSRSETVQVPATIG
jgi:S-adenosylmethionine-diacylglycerol 3-amino-3-carboxypropyl transferase